MAAWPSSSFLSSSWGGGAGTGGAVSFASLAASSSFPGGTAPGGNPVGVGGMNPFSPGQAAFGSGAGPSTTLSNTQPNPFSGQSSSVLGTSLIGNTSPFGASSLFSSASSSFGASTPFGSASSSSPFGASSTLFGASTSTFGAPSSVFGAPASSSSSLFGAPSSSSSPFGASSSSLFGAPSSSSSPFGASSSSLFGAPSSSPSPFGASSSSSPFGTPGGTAPAAALEGGQGAKSEGTKFIDAWKNLEAAAKGGVWPFSSFGVAEAECLFVGLDISPEEHRYLFYQRPQSEWRALGEQIVSTQLQHLRQFHSLVGEKAAADRLPFEAPPPSVEFLRLVLEGSLPQNASFSGPQETLQPPSLGVLGAPPDVNRAEVKPEVSNVERVETPGVRRDETDAIGAAFAAPQFEPGKIPDVPPPREVC